MKKIIPFLIIHIILISGKCQTLLPKLEGEWKAYHYIHGSDTVRFNKFWDMYQFHADGTYQMLQSNLNNDTIPDTANHFLQKGKFSETDSILKFSHVKEFEMSDGYFLTAKENRIIWVNDSTLAFSIPSRDSNSFIVEYRRINEQVWNMANNNIDGTWVGWDDNVYYPTFHLENSMDSRKRKKINGNYSLYYNFVRMSPLADSIEENIQWIGMITALNDTVVSFKVYNERIEYYDPLTFSYITHTSDYNFTNAPVKTGPIMHAEINYSSPGTEVLNEISSGIFTTGLVTGLIIAPLASIRYKQGGFNENRYFRMAGYSMGSAIVILPVVIATLEKKYTLTTRNGTKSKRNWLVVY